jgi:hypothetical protein
MAVAVADLRISRRRRALERFVDSMNAGRKSIDDAFDGLIAAAEEYERALALDPIGESVANEPDRTGEIELAMEIVGKGEWYIRELVKQNKIPHHRLPSSGEGSRATIVFTERSLREWLKSHEVRPEAR